jgi:type IV pilus biogenesis protein CpaD/CtpE
MLVPAPRRQCLLQARRTALLLTAAALLSACASSSSLVTGTPRAPIAVEQVKLYTHPPSKYQEIAVLESSSRNSMAFGDQAKLELVIERMKKEAARLGANGVLLQGTSNESGGAIGTGVGSGGMAGSVGIGVGLGTSFELVRKVGRGLAIWVEAE